MLLLLSFSIAFPFYATVQRVHAVNFGPQLLPVVRNKQTSWWWHWQFLFAPCKRYFLRSTDSFDARDISIFTDNFNIIFLLLTSHEGYIRIIIELLYSLLKQLSYPEYCITNRMKLQRTFCDVMVMITVIEKEQNREKECFYLKNTVKWHTRTNLVFS